MRNITSLINKETATTQEQIRNLNNAISQDV
jgi:hypothetical protein